MYVEACVARHWPSPVRDMTARRRAVTRNDLWSWWRHRRWWAAVRFTVGVVAAAASDAAVRAGLRDALRRAGPVLRQRRRISRELERHLAMLDVRAGPR